MMRASRWDMSRRVPDAVAAGLVGAAFATLVWAEWRRPLRRRRRPKLRRIVRNLAVAGAAGATVQTLGRPILDPLTRRVDRDRLGVVPGLRLHPAAETLAVFLLLDYTLYLWHVAAHKIPLLWRLHRVHHVDLDMDASTGLRFHFGELALATAFHASQIRLIGARPLPFSLWSTFLLLCVLFHHSNVRLPARLERTLNRVFVTPRLHGIHHSTRRDETDSNWSSGLTLWDALHRTLRRDVPQHTITIGVPAYQHEAAVTLRQLAIMPITGGGEESDWQ